MTVQETREAIAVMEAFVAGKAIQYRTTAPEAEWINFPHPGGSATPSWNWQSVKYRVAPPPLIERWVVIDPSGVLFQTFTTKEDAERYVQDVQDRASGGYRVAFLREVRPS